MIRPQIPTLVRVIVVGHDLSSPPLLFLVFLSDSITVKLNRGGQAIEGPIEPFIFSLPDARAQPDGQPMVIDSKTKLTLLNRSPRAPFKKCQLYDTRGFYKIRGMKGVRAFNDLVTIGFR